MEDIQLPPPYIVRLVLIYGRSQCVPQVSPEAKKVVCYLLTQALNRLVVDYPSSRDHMLFSGKCGSLFSLTSRVSIFCLCYTDMTPGGAHGNITKRHGQFGLSSEFLLVSIDFARDFSFA